MYLFSRPPIVRYLAAAALLVLSMWWDLRPIPSEPRLFARSDISAGTPLTVDLFSWVELPVGLLPALDPVGVAAIAIARGDPLTAGAITTVVPPPGWWTVEMALPSGAAPGSHVQIALLHTDTSQNITTVPGLILSPGEQRSSFQNAVGLVAVPEQHLAAVASSISQNRVVVFLGRVTER